MTPDQITQLLTTALGHVPSTLETQCYNRLTLYLNREPTPSEIGNMMSDSNLVMWVLTGQ